MNVTPSDALAWFEEIANTSAHHNDHGGMAKWLADAQSALEAIFPETHAVRRQWQAALADLPSQAGVKRFAAVHSAQGIFKSAFEQLKNGRLVSIIRSVQAETVGELLDQAQALLGHNYCVAATVVAGGALETHLRHLCDRNELTWHGDGSISKYDQAIAQARNRGTEIYSATDSKLVIGWGGLRNDAAHTPATFTRGSDDVRLMIEGIRQFIARTT